MSLLDTYLPAQSWLPGLRNSGSIRLYAPTSRKTHYRHHTQTIRGPLVGRKVQQATALHFFSSGRQLDRQADGCSAFRLAAEHSTVSGIATVETLGI
jgi:hypothetical protein